MKQKQFEQEHAALWQEMEAILHQPSKAAPDLPVLYRRLCQSLALSLQRGYSPVLTQYLHTLVNDGHRLLYGTAVERPQTLYQWLFQEMPRQVRQEWRLLLLAVVAFWGVALATGLLVWWQPHWAYSFMQPEQLLRVQMMYQPEQVAIGRANDSGDLQMFGFYIWNNVSIDFRTFAAGILGGVPALLSLMFNGMHLGVVASWLSQESGTRSTFWPFVVTHASFEITGLLLASIGGMRMGLSLIAPGSLTRRHALMLTSQRMFSLLVGAAIFTTIAAFFEGFWSASTSIPAVVKYSVAAVCWSAIAVFFVWAGRAPRP